MFNGAQVLTGPPSPVSSPPKAPRSAECMLPPIPSAEPSPSRLAPGSFEDAGLEYGDNFGEEEGAYGDENYEEVEEVPAAMPGSFYSGVEQLLCAPPPL